MFASEAMSNHPLTQIEIMNRLKQVGFTQEQAETQAQIITEVNDNSLATKQDVKNLEQKTDSEFAFVSRDIGDLRKDMNSEFALVRKEMHSEFVLVRKEMHGEFALVRKEMESLKLDLTVRMTVIMGSLLTFFGAIQKFFN